MNYTELVAEVNNLTNRTYSTEIVTWADLVEGIVARDLRCVEMLEEVTLAEVDRSADEVYNLPTDFLEERLLKSPSGVTGIPLQKVGLETVYTYTRDNSLWGYALTGQANAPQVAFIGTPSTDVEIDVLYFARQTLTKSGTNTNKLLTNHPEVYLHGVLLYAYQKSQDLELAQAHSDQLVETMRTLNEQAGRYLGGTIAKAAYNLGVYNTARGRR